MSAEKDWAKDGEGFQPDEPTKILLYEIGLCLQSPKPDKYLTKEYPPADKIGIQERLVTCVYSGAIMVAATLGMEKMVEGLSNFTHIMP
jgi:hypothetical protein